MRNEEEEKEEEKEEEEDEEDLVQVKVFLRITNDEQPFCL